MVVGKMFYRFWLPAFLLCFVTLSASGQSFRVQCPSATSLHPSANASAPYTGPTTRTVTIHQDGNTSFPLTYVDDGGAIKCQQISGGDGYATMADGTQTYPFAFGPLSGLAKIANGQPGTDFPNEFNTIYAGPMLQPGDPATTVNAAGTFTFNGAVGQVPDLDNGGAI